MVDRVVEVVVVYNERDTATGRSLPAIFNEHKAGAAADWLVFCHQDFVVFDDDWIERLTRLSEGACYGPIGVDRSGRFLGRIMQTDGTCIGQPEDGADVVGLDEQCLIVPRPIYSTVDFDERFAFDLYAHDYCLTPARAGFRVKTFQMNCQHRSKSVAGDTTRLSYLEAKRT